MEGTSPDADGRTNAGPAAGLDASVTAEVADALPDPVIVLDAAINVVWGNAAAVELFGMTLDDAEGVCGLDLVHPDDLQVAMVSWGAMQHKDAGTLLEVRLRAFDGWRLVELRGARLDEWLVLCLRDLTDRRRWEVARDETARFRSLMQNGASITLLLDRDGLVRSTSGVVTRLLGHDQGDLEHRPLASFVVPSDRARLADALARLATSDDAERRVTVDVRMVHTSGYDIPFALTIVDLLDDPTVEGLVVSGHDILDRVMVEDELRAANSLLNATLDSTTDGILVVDANGRIASHNSRFSEMWTVPAGVRFEHADSGAISLAASQLADPERFVAQARYLASRPDDESHDVIEFLDGRVFERDSRPQRIDGHVVGRVWSFRDVTEQRRLQDELASRALHDSLTGLANQTLFRDRVAHAATRLRRVGGRIAVLFIDLDDFKTVNDSLGHARGDELLVTVSRRLVDCLRTTDTAARLGGDEFAVLLEELGDGDAEVIEIADRLLCELGQPLTIDGRRLLPAASIGIAFGTSAATADDLLRNADIAMYRAKSAGKARHEVFAPEMHAAAMERLEVQADLRLALERGELVVHYQPIVELSSGRIRGMEALVRWQHPERGLLMPAAFVPVADESGLIDQLGAFVLETACAEAASWPVPIDRSATTISVNLAPHQLLDDGLPGRVGILLDRVGLDHRRLVLEITETALMADPDAATRNLQALRDLGVNLAVDDFGAGYSSLTYLQQFPIDVLKIDRSFVNRLEGGAETSLAQAIVQLALTLGLTPVGEGVETHEQARLLASFGCELVQGYLYGRPAAADVARALLSSPAGARLTPG